MRITTQYETTKLWLSARETSEWARHSCSELGGHRLFAEFYRGDLVDVAVDGKSSDVPADEVTAITSDFLWNGGTREKRRPPM